MATSPGEGKTLNSNLVNFALKIDLVSHPAHAMYLINTYIFPTWQAGKF